MKFDYHIFKSAQKPYIIAGPCAAESRDQLLDTARAIKDVKDLVAFRAGLWKPRTRPGDFEGVGNEGLEWMKAVKEETGLKLAVEIIIPQHAEACLKAGVDIVWIGARTVVNPFMVDELASALQGSEACVMVKNPLNPDPGLWAGGFERLLKQGISSLAAIHRGFDAFYSKPYRNLPHWEIPIELKNRFPGLQVICDPSHIAGRRDLIAAVSQKALDLGMDGLMIEAHIDPPNALTDVSQQLAPTDMVNMLDSLVIKDQGSADTILDKYRTNIDELDDQLLEILSKRMYISSQIGKLKKKRGLAPYQPDRWTALLEDKLEKAKGLKLDRHFVKKIYQAIHVESMKKQE
jgi:chorismate mutase